MKFQGKDSLKLFTPIKGSGLLKGHLEHVQEEYAKFNQRFEEQEGDPPADPKDEDYEFVWFRHLSETVVGAHSWKATDFTKSGLLKKAAPLINAVSVYTNHMTYVGNEVGIVGPPKYTKAYKNSQGQDIPGGIDAPVIIDKVIFPKLVRLLKSKYGSPIDSVSVGIEFEWEASHDFEYESDFYYHLGEMVDGTMVRRIAELIVSFDESSLVWMGADPYAKIHQDGEVVKIDRAGLLKAHKFGVDPQSKAYESTRKIFIYDGPGFSKSNFQFSNPLNDDPKMKEIIAYIASQLKIPESEVTLDMVKKYSFVKADQFSQLQSRATELEAVTQERDSVKTQVETLTQERNELNTKFTDLEAKYNSESAAMKASMEAARKQAKELYTKFSEGNPNQEILEEIEKDPLPKLEAKAEMWGGKLYKEFGAACKDCGSTSISMRSSKEEEPGDPIEQPAHLSQQLRVSSL